MLSPQSSKRSSSALKDMPTTMKQLAVVQFFTWFASAVHVAILRLSRLRNTSFLHRTKSHRLFAAGTEWGGLSFAVYNVACFLVAFLIAEDRQMLRAAR